MSLSSAFFRGADAAILIFGVNQPETLRALTRWWSEFCACAPLSDEEMEDYCLVVVGNNTDLVPTSEDSAVSEVAALHFIDELVPPSESLSSSPVMPQDEGEGDWIHRHPPPRVPSASDDEVGVHDDANLGSDTSESEDIICVDETRPSVIHHTLPEANNNVGADGECSTPTILIPPRTRSIDVLTHHHKQSVKSRSRFSLAPNSTLSSTHTDLASFRRHNISPSRTRCAWPHASLGL